VKYNKVPPPFLPLLFFSKRDRRRPPLPFFLFLPFPLSWVGRGSSPPFPRVETDERILLNQFSPPHSPRPGLLFPRKRLRRAKRTPSHSHSSSEVISASSLLSHVVVRIRFSILLVGQPRDCKRRDLSFAPFLFSFSGVSPIRERTHLFFLYFLSSATPSFGGRRRRTSFPPFPSFFPPLRFASNFFPSEK